ncbi:thioredoxin family protein [Parapedobacter deserti]|uniref:Thioredoxin family protein n=1 Tax=Parapedobacter deserti TaxID=1912957 RepID=A0ABV7JIH4_9SPHI
MRERTSRSRCIALFGVMLATTTLGMAQVTFEQLSFEEAQAKAQKEGKIIFVDVMRSGPPSDHNKHVEEQVFTLDSISNFFRDNCVSIRMDMGSEAGKAFVPNLNMLMYPAYVFYDAKGAQLQYTNAYAVMEDPTVLMQKARASAAVAAEKKTNTRSIIFADGSWAAVLQQAKTSGKLIFLDAQTEWCRPCRMMERDVFTLDRVADFYNGQFINISMDMEKGDGPELVKQYGIMAYPTYLFIDGDGNVVHQDGGFMEADRFIAVGQKALQARGQANQYHAEPGILFSEDGTWESLLQQAAVENKLIFLDGYAVWCGPCKTMDREVFTREEVGSFFNQTFINVKRDMERGEGIALKERYNIKAYPTYLFINAKGEEVHRIVGSSSADEFINKAQIALQPENQLAALNQRYASGDRSATFIQQYLKALSMAYRQDEAASVATAYLDALPRADLITEINWTLATSYLTDPNSSVLGYLAVHRDELRGVGVENGDEAIENLFSKGFHRLFAGDGTFDERAFKKTRATIKKCRLPHADELIRLAKLVEAGKTANWKNYIKLLDNVVSKRLTVYGQSIPVSLSVFAGKMLRETSETYASNVLGWADTLLATMDHALDRAKLYDLKQLAYQQTGDEEKAKLASAESKELVAQWSKENSGSGMMMAIPMKLQ